jgi:hypothetical protein
MVWYQHVGLSGLFADNATLNKGLFRELAPFMEEREMQFRFYGLTRIDLLDIETIELLSLMGFQWQFIRYIFGRGFSRSDFN